MCLTGVINGIPNQQANDTLRIEIKGKIKALTRTWRSAQPFSEHGQIFNIEKKSHGAPTIQNHFKRYIISHYIISQYTSVPWHSG